jgi:hypothetical protein
MGGGGGGGGRNNFARERHWLSYVMMVSTVHPVFF